MKSVRYLLLFLSLFFLASCKEEKPISEDTEKEPEIIEEHVHDLIHHEALEPTCTKSGHNEYDECRTCDYSTLTIIPPLGHSYDSGVVTKEASCTEEGIITYTCTRCGDTYTETIEKLEHEYELVEVIEPTYEEEGKKIYRCKVCGDEYSEVIGKKEYLSLSDVTGKDPDITKWQIWNVQLGDGAHLINDSNDLKIILDLFAFNFQESGEFISFFDEEGKNEKNIPFRLMFTDDSNFSFYLYYEIGVVECIVTKNDVTKYYYSYNSFNDFSFIKDVYYNLEFIEKCDNYIFNPYIDIVEGEKYSLFEVLSYILNSDKLLSVKDMAIFSHGGVNSRLFKNENIEQLIKFYEGEYEAHLDDNYYVANSKNIQISPGFCYVMDYFNNKRHDLIFNVVGASMNIISEDDFGFTFLIYKDGEFKYITFKGCFTLEEDDVIEELAYKLRDEEIKEAEESGIEYYKYWTQVYYENHNN